MTNSTYLIVGGGMTADAAVHGIREVEPSGLIGLLSAEGHPPYDRPPSSKKLWKGKPLESIWRQTESQEVLLHLGRTARHLDLQANGGTPRLLEGVVYYLRDGRVRGLLLWNTWEQVDAARSLIAEPGTFRLEALKGRLPA